MDAYRPVHSHLKVLLGPRGVPSPDVRYKCLSIMDIDATGEPACRIQAYHRRPAFIAR